MGKNLCSKTVTKELAYEVWTDASGQWKWFVLKKYKSEEVTLKDPFARYLCAVQSPMTNGKYDVGDVYATQVKDGNHQIPNPLCTDEQTSVQELKRVLIVQAVTDEVREHFTVTDLTPRARKHKKYQIELPAECEHTISKQHSIIGPIEFYDCRDGRIIVTDHAWNQVNASMKKAVADEKG